MPWKKLITFYFFIFSISGYSQTENLPNTMVPLSQYQLRSWSTNEGLISNNLTNVFQSSDGYIWISSYNGINCFDGKNIRLYDNKTVPALRSNAVYQFFEDDEGMLWISTQGSGLITFDPGA